MDTRAEIQHDANAHRFSTQVDGQLAWLEYVPGEDRITIVHTVVPEAIGGRGIAGELVRAALDHARASGLKVVPRCSYAAAYFDRHPEYADLRA